jgi:hypothetical protein
MAPMRAAHRLPIASIVSIAALAVACTRQGPAVVAPVETAEIGDGGPVVPLVITAAPPAARDRERCTARLRSSIIKTNAGCTLDERISHGNGTLLYPCIGDGPIEAIFGEHRFTGKITDSTMVLVLGTELDWEDGCHWETKQTLLGDWKRDSKKRAKLAWSYSEAPVSGTGCFGSCTATADVEIVPDDPKP